MPDQGMGTVAISGASGLIGSALSESLAAAGWRVRPMVRRPARTVDEISWSPGDELDAQSLDGVDVVVNLAGAGVGDHRWTAAYKRQIRDSRVEGTTTIAEAISRMDAKPRLLLNASAIGYYGDVGLGSVDESAQPGAGFLAGVVQEWEAATEPAAGAGVRVACARTGLVVSSEGGAWGRMLPLFKFGLGGKLGNGRQYWSFISLRDEIRALRHIIDGSLSGPVNLTAPNPVTNSEVARAMGRAMGRPALLPAPAFALRAVLGEFSTDVLSSARVLPAALQRDGFTWLDPTIEDAIATLLAA